MRNWARIIAALERKAADLRAAHPVPEPHTPPRVVPLVWTTGSSTNTTAARAGSFTFTIRTQ